MYELSSKGKRISILGSRKERLFRIADEEMSEKTNQTHVKGFSGWVVDQVGSGGSKFIAQSTCRSK